MPIDHPIRLHEISDGGALLQEFRIRHHVELDVGVARLERFAHRALHLVRGAHRNGGFGDHHLVFAHVLADGVRHVDDMAQIRRTILIRRRAYRDQLEQAMIDALLGIGREA